MGVVRATLLFRSQCAFEHLLALSNPCWTLPVGCSLVHRGRVESTINLYPAKGKAMSQTRKLLTQIKPVCQEIRDMKLYSSIKKNHSPQSSYHRNKERLPNKYGKDGRDCTCHELAFFTFFSLLFYCIDTCCYSPKSCSKTNLHSLIIHFAF